MSPATTYNIQRAHTAHRHTAFIRTVRDRVGRHAIAPAHLCCVCVALLPRVRSAPRAHARTQRRCTWHVASSRNPAHSLVPLQCGCCGRFQRAYGFCFQTACFSADNVNRAVDTVSTDCTRVPPRGTSLCPTQCSHRQIACKRSLRGARRTCGGRRVQVGLVAQHCKAEVKVFTTATDKNAPIACSAMCTDAIKR